MTGCLVFALFWAVRHCRPAEPGWGDRELRVGYAIEAPYAFVRQDGTVAGEGPEIARIVAERLGVRRVVWRQMEFSSLISELLGGQIDVIAAGLFITEERAKQVAFSRETFRCRQGLLVAAGNPLGLHSYAEVRRKAARVAVLANSVEERHFRREWDGVGGELLVVPDARSGVEVLVSGRVDALALSAPSLRWMHAQQRDARVDLAEPFEQPAGGTWPQGGGFAFRPEDVELRARWDRELAQFLGSARHVDLVRALGFTGDELPAGGPAVR